MKKRIAVNGLGRIGKQAIRVFLSRFFHDFELVAINAPGYTSDTAAYTILYDSLYGYFHEFEITGKDDFLYIHKTGKPNESQRVKLFSTFDAAQLPWKELEVDVVVECSGAYKDYESASAHLQAGAKKVVLSSPTKDTKIPTVVLGANDTEFSFQAPIISNASCTTNCIAPLLAILNTYSSLQFVNGITVHAYTQSQSLLDKEAKKGMREGRAAALNIIPTSTGASQAVEQVLPTLKNRISLTSMRVPVASGSCLYLSCETKESIDIPQIHNYFAQAARNNHKGILFLTDQELVSSDCIGTPYSAILDTTMTQSNENHLQLVAWYDNEWGYSNRLLEVVKKAMDA